MNELARKLGVRPGHRVCFLNVPPGLRRVLRGAMPPGVRISLKPGRRTYDLIVYFPRRRSELERTWRGLEKRILPDGAVWAVTARKPFLLQRGFNFSWEDVQAAALRTSLVDNKIASLTREEYATRFVIRRKHRPAAA